MALRRFFVPPESIQEDEATLRGEIAHRVATVLRLRPGDEVTLLDNSGLEYQVRLEKVTPDEARGAVLERTPSINEPGLQLTLYQGVLKGEKFELVLQKGTELGISRFVPIMCARSVPQGVTLWEAGRYPRWRKVIQGAAEQSRRGKLPSLEPPVEFNDACDALDGIGLLPWEEEAGLGMRFALRQVQPWANRPLSVAIFIGPEGGFTAQEVEYARSRSITTVSLGKRILRAETAGLVTAAAVMYEWGELG